MASHYGAVGLYGAPHSTALLDQSEELITLLMAIFRDPSLVLQFDPLFTLQNVITCKHAASQAIWVATDRLLSPQLWVRITQGALPETAAKPGTQSVRPRDPTGRAFEPKQPETPINRHLLPGSEMGINQLGHCGAPDCALPGRGRQGG